LKRRKPPRVRSVGSLVEMSKLGRAAFPGPLNEARVWKVVAAIPRHVYRRVAYTIVTGTQKSASARVVWAGHIRAVRRPKAKAKRGRKR
jgi:hypothetical protein